MPHAGQKWDIILKPAKMHYITSFNFNNTTKPAIVLLILGILWHYETTPF